MTPTQAEIALECARAKSLAIEELEAKISDRVQRRDYQAIFDLIVDHGRRMAPVNTAFGRLLAATGRVKRNT